MKALARYQVILLGEQRHIRCEQLAQGCCPNNAEVGVEPATSWSWVQRPTATLPHCMQDGNTNCTQQRGIINTWTWLNYLEHHVLEEMCNTIILVSFMAVTGFSQNTNLQTTLSYSQSLTLSLSTRYCWCKTSTTPRCTVYVQPPLQ